MGGQQRWLLPAVLAFAMLPAGGQPDPDTDLTDGLVHRVSMGDHAMSVLVVPQRPGWNLVLLQGERAAAGLDRRHLTPASERPGAAGRWALVRLPRGESRLWVRQHGHTFDLTVHTGPGHGMNDLTEPDGPECASALLGRALAGRPETHCPNTSLRPADGAALRSTIGFIAGRGARTLTVIEDASPRAAEAARQIRAAAQRRGITVRTENEHHNSGPVVVVSGWAGAERALRRIATGTLRARTTYLAPWLLSTPLLTISAGVLIPLRFAPGDEQPTRYRAALAATLPGAPPTGSGYDAWLGETRPDGPVRLYAPLTVDLHPAVLTATATGRPGHHRDADGSDWLPGGRLTAVSPPLSTG